MSSASSTPSPSSQSQKNIVALRTASSLPSFTFTPRPRDSDVSDPSKMHTFGGAGKTKTLSRLSKYLVSDEEDEVEACRPQETKTSEIANSRIFACDYKNKQWKDEQRSKKVHEKSHISKKHPTHSNSNSSSSSSSSSSSGQFSSSGSMGPSPVSSVLQEFSDIIQKDNLRLHENLDYDSQPEYMVPSYNRLTKQVLGMPAHMEIKTQKISMKDEKSGKRSTVKNSSSSTNSNCNFIARTLKKYNPMLQFLKKSSSRNYSALREAFSDIDNAVRARLH
jgi:hypothetical protein